MFTAARSANSEKKISHLILHFLISAIVVTAFSSTPYSSEAGQEYIFSMRWGKEGTGDGEFNIPHSIAFDGLGNAYVTDTNNHRIQKFSSDGKFITKWGSEGSDDGKFSTHAHGVAIDSFDNVYVTDRFNHNIQKFTSDGKFITKWGSEGSGDGQFDEPHSSAIDSSDQIYVSDMNNHRIQRFTSDGKFITKWGSEGSGAGQFLLPLGIDVAKDDSLFIVDQGKSEVQTFLGNGTSLASKLYSQDSEESAISQLEDIELDQYDSIYLTDRGDHSVKKFSETR